MSRVATASELVKLASDGQASRVYAHVINPSTVFSARVNQTSITWDRLSQLTFDTVTTGGYTAIAPGMTVLIGSSAGAYDLGIAVARKAATSTVLYLGQTSNIRPADNSYITVLNDFAVWPKHANVKSDGSEMWINYDEAYVTQLSEGKPIIVAGGDRAVELTASTVAVSFALSATVAIGTDGVFGFVSSCATASATSGLTTNAPEFTFNAAGDHRIKIACTAPSGATSTTYRWVYVFSAGTPPANCILESNDGDNNGWSASITLYETQSLTSVRDRAKVIIFAKDYYDNVLGSIGALDGCENVITSGWIAGSTIDYDADKGSVSFEVKPASWWLDQEQNTIEVALIASATSANWHHMTSVTVDRMIWHLCENYSTLLNSSDLILSGDTRTAQSIVAPIGTVWSQITAVADRIKALVNINMYGQVFHHID